MVRALPTEYAKRDGSGVPLAQGIDILGGSIGATPAGQAPGDGLPQAPATRAPLRPVADSLPFADSGVVEVEAAKRVAVQDSLLED